MILKGSYLVHYDGIGIGIIKYKVINRMLTKFFIKQYWKEKYNTHIEVLFGVQIIIVKNSK